MKSLIKLFTKKQRNPSQYYPRSPWEVLKGNIRERFFTKRAPLLTLYLQTLENTEGNYYFRLQLNGQFDTVVDGKYSPKFEQN